MFSIECTLEAPFSFVKLICQVYRRMLGILNRVTQQSLGIFLEQARELPLSDPTHLPHILSLLLEKVRIFFF